MKVILSTSTVEPSVNKGIIDGMGHYTLQIQSNLRKRGYQVSGMAFPKVFQKNNFLSSASFPRPYEQQMFWSLINGSRPFKMNCHVFHSTDYRIIPVNVPVVATIWDAIFFAFPEFAQSIKSKIIAFLFKKSSRYADRVIAVSEHAAKDLIKFFDIPEDRIRLIPWSIGKEWRVKKTPEEIEKVQKIYGLQSPYVLSVGTLQPRKNFGRLIEAFLTLPSTIQKNTKLVIVGKAGWFCEDVLKKILAFPENIIHLTNVNNDNALRCLYQGSECVVFPSLYEGFGMPALEAFASGTPLIASNVTSIPEVVGDGALMIDPLSVASMTKALYDVLKNADIKKDLIEKGYERLNLFQEEVMISKVIDVYQEVI